MDGWKTILSYWGPAYFQGRLLLVSESGIPISLFREYESHLNLQV